MLTKTRSDFRFCEVRGDIALPSDPHSHQFCEGHHRNATNVEVLIAWLSADDERRKEIEVASRPTKAGDYVQYTLRSCNWTLSDCLWGYDDFLAHNDSPDIDGLWERIEE